MRMSNSGMNRGSISAERSRAHMTSRQFRHAPHRHWSGTTSNRPGTLETTRNAFAVQSYIPRPGKLFVWLLQGPTGPRLELVGRAMQPFVESGGLRPHSPSS